MLLSINSTTLLNTTIKSIILSTNNRFRRVRKVRRYACTCEKRFAKQFQSERMVTRTKDIPGKKRDMTSCEIHGSRELLGNRRVPSPRPLIYGIRSVAGVRPSPETISWPTGSFPFARDRVLLWSV